MTIDDIADRLLVSRSTVYGWIRDLPLPARASKRGRAGSAAMQAKFKRLREEAYAAGAAEFGQLDTIPSFRDFVCMYIGEGTKRDRNMVAICNSDPAVVTLANRWMLRLSSLRVTYGLQFHADQDPQELIDFWANQLEVDPSRIAIQRKSNSGQLKGRNWRSERGVLMVRTCDTAFRCRIQAWMDRVKSEWSSSGGESCLRVAG